MTLPQTHRGPITDDAIFLVSCVAQKAPARVRAADLYQSDWFRKARAYVQSTGCRWFILSAEHGLLHPDTPVEPYDATLAAMGARGRRDWGGQVAGQLDTALGTAFRGPIIFLAGRHYRTPLLAYAGSRARVPMEGLGIGQQKAWLAAHTARGRP